MKRFESFRKWFLGLDQDDRIGYAVGVITFVATFLIIFGLVQTV